MKKTAFLLGLLLLILVAFVSCETETTVPAENDIYDTELMGMLDFVTTMSNVDYSDITFCGIPQGFELWYTAPESYGYVIVYNNAESLHIIYRLNKNSVEAGWSILSSYLFVGDYENLPYLENGSVNWYGDGVGLVSFEDNPTSVKISIPLSEISGCNGIATKVKLTNPSLDDAMVYPRAFLNIEGKLHYPWKQAYEYCIQECD